MDPVSISASIVAVSAICGKLAQNIGGFVIDTTELPDSLTEFYETIRNLHTALLNISHVLRQRPRQQPFERDHHHNIYQISVSCQAALERLDRLLPEMSDDPSTYEKIRKNLLMSMRKNSVQQAAAHLNSYTQVLQLSLITLSLGSLWGTQRSQEQIQMEIRNLTDSVRSAHLSVPDDQSETTLRAPTEELTPEINYDLTREIEAWRISADDVAAAVSLYDPEQLSMDPRAMSSTVLSDSGVDIESEAEEDPFDPEPEHQDCPSREILHYQIDQNQKMVKQLVRCGIFIKAAAYQRKGIKWKTRLAQVHGVPYEYDEEADMREFLAEILLGTETRESTSEGRAILEQLLQEEIDRGAGLDQQLRCRLDQHRRCRLYHRLGCLYMEQGNVKQARKALSRAFEGRKKIVPMPEELVIESCDALVKALQLDQKFAEARGYMEWKQREFRPAMFAAVRAPPQSGDEAGLSNAFAWCRDRGFDVDAPDFCFEVCDSAKGTSPLHLVIAEECLDVFREIAEHVVSFEHRDSEFATPLLLAASTRNRETTTRLLERGAKVDVRDRRGMSPLHRCQNKSGGVQVARVLVQYCPQTPSSSSITARPDLINVPDMTGKTAFHIAVEKGNEKMARFLLEAGANPDLTESYGKTGLYTACEKGDEKMVRCIIEKRANLNIPGPGLCTALIVAIEASVPINTKISMVEMLLSHGADPSIADADGQTAFTAARNAGFGSEIKRLLQKGDPRRLSTASNWTTTTRASSTSGSLRSRNSVNSGSGSSDPSAAPFHYRQQLPGNLPELPGHSANVVGWMPELSGQEPHYAGQPVELPARPSAEPPWGPQLGPNVSGQPYQQ